MTILHIQFSPSDSVDTGVLLGKDLLKHQQKKAPFYHVVGCCLWRCVHSILNIAVHALAIGLLEAAGYSPDTELKHIVPLHADCVHECWIFQGQLS